MPTDAAGRLMESAVRDQAAYLRRCGAHGLMVLGSTGEFPLFSADERVQLLHRLVELVAPLPVIANISDIRPGAVARLGRAARESGCAGVAILPPWYFVLGQADLLEFFLRAAEAAAPLPTFLYNFPERVGNTIAVETMAAFADRAPLAGVKLSGGAWDLHAEVVALGRSKSFSVLTGWDTRLADAMALGCRGCISGFSNFAAESVVGTFRAVEAGDAAAVAETTRQLRDTASLLQGLLFPHDVAAGMLARGFVVGEPKQVTAASSLRGRDAVVVQLREQFRSRGWT